MVRNVREWEKRKMEEGELERTCGDSNKVSVWDGLCLGRVLVFENKIRKYTLFKDPTRSQDGLGSASIPAVKTSLASPGMNRARFIENNKYIFIHFYTECIHDFLSNVAIVIMIRDLKMFPWLLFDCGNIDSIKINSDRRKNRRYVVVVLIISK